MRAKWAAEAAGTGADVPGPEAAQPSASRPILEGGRRDRRRRERLAAASAGEKPAAEGNADVAGMNAQEVLAARAVLEEQARGQAAALAAAPSGNADAVDPEVLAQQRALAARAALLNRRTAQMQRDAADPGTAPVPGNDPAAVTNLAMVTPLEFVTVPGVDFPVMKPPATTHIPIITPALAEPAAGAGEPEPAEPVAVEPAPAEPAGREPVAGEPAKPAVSAAAVDVPSTRSAVAVAEPLEPVIAGARPVGARSAFGLDPLDVMTAGLGRTRKLRYAVFAVAGLGAIALIIGIVMIVGGFGS